MSVLAIDIGGTKTFSGCITDAGKIVGRIKRPTQKGKSGLTNMVFDIVRYYLADDEFGPITNVAIGVPGCLQGRTGTVIRKGTGRQLGVYSGEFDDCDIGFLLRECLPSNIPLVLLNDAVAQCLGGVQALKIENGSIGYIGPGTGLGGAFVDLNGSLPEVKTDGHIYDIAIPCPITGQLIQAEDILSGRGIVEQWGVQPVDLNTPDGIILNTDIIESLGQGVVDLILALKSGSPRHLSKK